VRERPTVLLLWRCGPLRLGCRCGPLHLGRTMLLSLLLSQCLQRARFGDDERVCDEAERDMFMDLTLPLATGEEEEVLGQGKCAPPRPPHRNRRPLHSRKGPYSACAARPRGRADTRALARSGGEPRTARGLHTKSTTQQLNTNSTPALNSTPTYQHQLHNDSPPHSPQRRGWPRTPRASASRGAPHGAKPPHTSQAPASCDPRQLRGAVCGSLPPHAAAVSRAHPRLCAASWSSRDDVTGLRAAEASPAPAPAARLPAPGSPARRRA